MKITFQDRSWEVVFTEHARLQMDLRQIGESEVLDVIENGTAKPKESPGKYWVYKAVKGRKDNLISVSIALEKPRLILITAMVNWRPK